MAISASGLLGGGPSAILTYDPLLPCLRVDESEGVARPLALSFHFEVSEGFVLEVFERASLGENPPKLEKALIQALGATPSKVFAVTTIEAVVASAAGALLGGVLSIAITDAVRRAAVVDVGSVTPLIFPVSEATRYAVLAMMAAVFAAVLPAWKNNQAAPSTELRDE